MTYVIQTIDEDKEKEYMYRIAEFYSYFLQSQYKVNSAVDPSEDVFTQEEKDFIISLAAESEDESNQLVVTEQALLGLTNIDNCLQYLIKLAERKQDFNQTSAIRSPARSSIYSPSKSKKGEKSANFDFASDHSDEEFLKKQVHETQSSK